MFSKSRIVWALFGLAALGVLGLISCAKRNDYQHAPVCPYGQVLVYSNNAYTCRYVSLNPLGVYAQPYQDPNSPILNPPVSSCGMGDQVLINWNNQWLCYSRDIIYPPNGDSPISAVPPVGRGGEYCTSVGYGAYGNYGYQNPYQQYNYGMNSVVCSPGFTCQATGTTTPTPGVSPTNPYYYQQGYQAYGYGQSGACVYMGYYGR